MSDQNPDANNINSNKPNSELETSNQQHDLEKEQTRVQPESPNLESNRPDKSEIEFINSLYEKTKSEIQKVIVGNDQLIQLVLAAMFSGGHILLEGVPGVAKTLIAKLLSQCMNIEFKRIQFTPDLLPSDLIGVSLYNTQKSEFIFKRGPIFSNLVLIDEINRSPAKTQAALFEAMEEKQITVDGTTYPLGQPFFVIATQNPIEQEGTYRLPEAQQDRFIFKLKVEYPELKDEIAILQRFKSDFSQKKLKQVNHVITAFDIEKCLSTIEKVYIKDELIEYIANIVQHSRNNSNLFLGASPRASMAILKTSKALAAINGRDFVTPDDIQRVCYPVLCHRVILSPEKEMEGITIESVIREMIKKIEVPR